MIVHPCLTIGKTFDPAPENMVGVGKHFAFLLIVVEWLKYKSTELLKFENSCSPNPRSTKFRGFGGTLGVP